MTRGWGEVARVCHAEGALAIHFVYDSASMLFFKVFDEEGHRLKSCPEGGHPDGTVAGAGPAASIACSSSSESADLWWSSDSPKLVDSSEMSDYSYVPPSSRRARSRAAASSRR